MITITYRNERGYIRVIKEAFPEVALKKIRSLQNDYLSVEWTCDDPEDNEYIWERL